jgi:hypothetical protein
VAAIRDNGIGLSGDGGGHDLVIVRIDQHDRWCLSWRRAAMADVSFRLLVLKALPVDQLRTFYQALGVDLAEERHSDGLVHYPAKSEMQYLRSTRCRTRLVLRTRPPSGASR